MSNVASTNRLYQHALQILQVQSANAESQESLELSFILVFERLLCALLVEALDADSVAVQDHSFVELLEQNDSLWLVKQLKQSMNEPGNWLNQYKLMRQLVLRAVPVKKQPQSGLIATTTDSDPSQQFRQWLAEFDALASSVRELNQEY